MQLLGKMAIITAAALLSSWAMAAGGSRRGAPAWSPPKTELRASVAAKCVTRSRQWSNLRPPVAGTVVHQDSDHRSGQLRGWLTRASSLPMPPQLRKTAHRMILSAAADPKVSVSSRSLGIIKGPEGLEAFEIWRPRGASAGTTIIEHSQRQGRVYLVTTYDTGSGVETRSVHRPLSSPAFKALESQLAKH